MAPGGRAAVVTWRAAPPRSRVEVLELAVRERPAGPWRTVRLMEDEDVYRVSLSTIGPRLAAGADGRMVAVWPVPRLLSETSIHARELPAGSLTPGPEAALGQPDRFTGHVGVGVSDAGEAVAVWAGPFYGASLVPSPTPVRAAVRPAGLAGWAPIDLAPPGVTVPAVAVAPDGAGIVVWRRNEVGIEAAARPAGGAFGPPEAVGSGPNAVAPDVAVDRAGTALAVWYHGGVMSASRPAAGAWSAPEPLSAPFTAPLPARIPPPAVAIGADGTAAVAWRRVVEGRFVVEAAVRRPGGAWSAPLRISPLRPRNAGAPTLAVGDDGTVLIAWAQPVGRSGSAIRARTLAAGATGFGRVERPSASGRRATAPLLGIDARGRATLVWNERPGTVFRGILRAAWRPATG